MRSLRNELLASCVALTSFGGSAHAADLRVVPKALPSMPYSWRGFYAGVQGGVAFPRGDASARLVSVDGGGGTAEQSVAASNPTFGFGGIEAGYNQQSGRWVYGLETDISSGSTRETIGFLTSPSSPSTLNASLKLGAEWFGTARVRLGYLIDPGMLLFATGGLAYGGMKAEFTGTFITPIAGLQNLHQDGSKTAIGWVAGVGGERRLGDPRWSLKGEYQYLALESGSIDSTTVILVKGKGAATETAVSQGQQKGLHVVRIGLNYRFWE